MPKDFDPQDLLAQDAAHQKQRDAKRLLRQLEVDDFKWLMGNKQGRRFIWRLLEKAGVFRSTFRLNNEMAFLEGMRNVGLMLMADIHELCPEKYQVMVREQQDNDSRAKSVRAD